VIAVRVILEYGLAKFPLLFHFGHKLLVCLGQDLVEANLNAMSLEG